MTVAHVRGWHGIEITPDRARLHITVRGDGTSDLAATEAYNTALQGLQELLGQYDLHAQVAAPQGWHRGGKQARVLAGEVNVQVDDLAIVGLLVGYLASTEALSLRWVEWVVSTRAEVQRQARKDAVAASRAAAEDFADALGMEVEGIESISDPGVAGADEDYGSEEAFAVSGEYVEQSEGPTTVHVSEPRPVTISAAVHATYRLRPAD
jgi:uncharacterized protein DUF541